MKDINKIIKSMIKENMFGKEDIPEAKTILVWMHEGKKAAQKISKEAVKNLIKCGFVDKPTGKLCGAGEDIGMWFLLALNGAKGFIKQVDGGKDVHKKSRKK